MSRCLSNFSPLEEEGYSIAARARLADRRKIPHELDFNRADVLEIRSQTATRMSISGVQEKISLQLNRGKLTPVAQGGNYILKPVPGQNLPRLINDVPANENLTMQLAEQIFGIETAANACIRLADGELAYITRRFDRLSDGTPVAQEDFCQLMERTPDNAGQNYKYDSSYEELGHTLKRYCSAYSVEIEKLFRLIVFNYYVANGDAHLKNFSLRQTSSYGDYILSPAYDLLCTQLHIPNESRFALDFFADDEIPKGVESHGFVTSSDLLDLAQRFKISNVRARIIIDDICSHHKQALELVQRSFLSDNAKIIYSDILRDRLRALTI